jgi:hypothetical protein
LKQFFLNIRLFKIANLAPFEKKGEERKERRKEKERERRKGTRVKYGYSFW